MHTTHYSKDAMISPTAAKLNSFIVSFHTCWLRALPSGVWLIAASLDWSTG